MKEIALAKVGCTLFNPYTAGPYREGKKPALAKVGYFSSTLMAKNFSKFQTRRMNSDATGEILKDTKLISYASSSTLHSSQSVSL